MGNCKKCGSEFTPMSHACERDKDALSALRARVAELERERNAAVEAHAQLISRIAADGTLDAMERASAAESRVKRLTAEVDDAWEATGVAGTVRGLTGLADAVDTIRRSQQEALARVKRLEAALQAFVASHERECGDGLHRLICTCQTCALARAALAASEAEVGHD